MAQGYSLVKQTDAESSKKFEFKDDQLRPRAILEHLKAHDERMRNQATDWSLAKSMYMTQYWKFMRGGGPSPMMSTTWKNWVDVEVNRLFPFVNSYLAALYPRANHAIVMSDPAGLGDPEKAQLACNRWLSSQRVHQRVMAGIRQSIMYPGCGAKLGYTPGRGNPLDRVWLRVIPWWELVLDYDVSDPEDERFRGHVYYTPRLEFEARYCTGRLHGTRREDFLEAVFNGESTSGKRTKSSAATGRRMKARSDDEAFVRVLEICNLVDTIKDPNNPEIEYQGRLEIYVLNQENELSKKPVWMGPLPVAKFDGSPLPHVIPLIFNHEPEFPLRGMAHSQRLLPQMQEMNAYRAFMAMSTRKDSRQYLMREGTLGADEQTKLTDGTEGAIINLEKDFQRPLQDAIIPIPNSPMSTNIDRYMGYVEADFDRTVAASPQARGEITKATAFEVQTVQQYTESEFGMHAALKDNWIAEILRLFQRLLISSMQDTGDSAGAYDNKPVSLTEIGAIPTTLSSESNPAELAQQQKGATIAEVTGGPAPYVSEELAPSIGVETTPESTAVKIEQQTITMRDARNHDVIIAVPDLDAEFEISFVEGGRTPLSDAAMQQNLVALMQPYMALWQQVVAGGPMAGFSRAYMQTMAEHFKFPKDLYPQELEAKAQAEIEKAQAAQQPVPPEPTAEGQPPQQAPQDHIPPEALPVLRKALGYPAPQAIEVLETLFEGNEAIIDVLEQMKQLEPGQQQAAVRKLIGGLVQVAVGSAGGEQQEPVEGQPEAPVPMETF